LQPSFLAIGSNPFAAFSSNPSSSTPPSSRYRSSSRSSAFGPLERLFRIFQNPFSITVIACTGSLLFGGLALPPAALPSLDKAVAILETLLTFHVSYPASIAFGQVLLQTAPPERSIQMIALNKSLREVEGHPLVVYLAVSAAFFPSLLDLIVFSPNARSYNPFLTVLFLYRSSLPSSLCI
jgi:hypothetical protein